MFALPALPTFAMPILVGGAIVTASLGGFGGWKLRDADYQRHLRKDAELTVKIIDRTRSIEHNISTLSAAIRAKGDVKEAEVRTITKTIERKVPVYVTSTPQEEAIVADGGLPLGFVQLHTAAVLGVDPLLTTRPGTRSEDPSGVDLSTLARVDAGNYEVLHICRSRLEAWDEFYNTLKARWPSSNTSKEEPHE